MGELIEVREPAEVFMLEAEDDEERTTIALIEDPQLDFAVLSIVDLTSDSDAGISVSPAFARRLAGELIVWADKAQGKIPT